ncbi:class I SAM-dependent methyltransferase [Dactylosporangium sucinum]|uniref:Methyltransferase n=1 Tax=Dactylosporangium sucinum TaxID=1424081 RepID=A0A917X7Q2_9ACTN|nr:class I SAM-dependent methyltransferase [Dactylosporangium sucinum]GGM86933.1 methyltransferase [Dactylosporangium sucinum]
MTAPAPQPALQRAARPTCLLCGGTDAAVVVPLEPTPPANHLSATAEQARALPRYPLDLVHCPDCGLVQLGDVVDRAELFSDYRYATGAVPALVRHFGQLAEQVIDRLRLAAGARVTEIGSNDGTLLGFFAARGMRVLGVDPAAALAAEAEGRGVPTRVVLFDDEVAARIVAETGPSDVVLANNVLAHVRDINAVIAGIARLLAPDGTAVVEVAYVLPMVAGGMFEFIYHEHVAYYSLHVLGQAFARHGLTITDVEQIDTQGGSLRCWARPAHGAGEPTPAVTALLAAERAAGVADGRFLDGYGEAVRRGSGRLHDVVAGLHAQGRTICGYGASARAVTLLAQSRIGEYLAWIVDDNPRKVGLFTPGDGIEVRPRRDLDDAGADYCIVFAWNYADAVRANAAAFRAAGGDLVIPYPDLLIS